MTKKEKRYHYIYKTINNITGRYYYGMHSTDNLNDGYMGSGKRLRYSINKYGKENHKLEIIEFCLNRGSLIEKEIKLVTLNEIAKKDCMNLKIGGCGGMSINVDVNLFHTKGGKVSGKIHAKRLKEDIEYAKKHREIFIKTLKKLHSKGKLGYDWTNKKHTDEEKRKIGEASAKHQRGEGNSQSGTCWITNGIENKKIKKGQKIPDGWELGRKIN